MNFFISQHAITTQYLRVFKWRAEGLSEQQIQEKFFADGLLGAFGSAPDVNAIVHQIRNEGLSLEDGIKLATLAAFSKITNDASKGKVINWSVSNTVTSKFPTGWGDGSPNKKVLVSGGKILIIKVMD